jgi:hypothetical protein
MSTVAYPILAWALLALFVLRVLGQLIVVLWHPAWLPPAQEWSSGLIPYQYLLPIQVALIILLAATARDLTRGRGLFAGPYPRLGRALIAFSYLYAGSMLVRYTVQIAIHPDTGWFRGTIPIVFHWVLAAFLYTVGRYQAR